MIQDNYHFVLYEKLNNDQTKTAYIKIIVLQAWHISHVNSEMQSSPLEASPSPLSSSPCPLILKSSSSSSSPSPHIFSPVHGFQIKSAFLSQWTVHITVSDECLIKCNTNSDIDLSPLLLFI